MPSDPVEDLHGVASACGFVFPACDGVDALMYLVQGKWADAALSGAAIIPFGELSKGLRKGAHVVNGTEAAFRWSPDDGVPVIGRLSDTDVAREWPGHALVPSAGWSPEANAMWIDSIIEQRGVVYLASNAVEANFKGSNLLLNEGRSIFALEVEQLMRAGYTPVGDFLVPPRP